MLETLNTMGPFAWPMLLIAVANLTLIGLRLARLAGPKKAAAEPEAGIDAILFWGVLALLLGYLSQYAGLYNSMNGIASMQSVDPRIVAAGIAESIMATIFGFIILIVSASAWFFLRSRSRTTA